MKFKITEVKQVGDNLQVAVSHEECGREVFGLSLEFARDNKYIEEIKRILSEREKPKVQIDLSIIGKEIE